MFSFDLPFFGEILFGVTVSVPGLQCPMGFLSQPDFKCVLILWGLILRLVKHETVAGARRTQALKVGV